MMKRNAEATVKLLQYYRKVKPQYRNYSYLTEKAAQPSGGVMKQIGDNLISIGYKGAACGFGFAIAGLTTTSESTGAKKDKEAVVDMLKLMDKEEASVERVREMCLKMESRVQN
ncbi:unnamed protein product [Microthlaspi erraticum]|uniref:Uncharacterized protein n=1 Tax=Microthlaspi erraticum TaxID=1685480 RepID=A0A6D2HTP1_9BRAS|nr:unnamed protein product [Microthlaspi erraticum]